MDPIKWFNIARIFTLVGGFLTLAGGVGLWYFGKINAINTNKEIQTSKENAAVAEAAKANTKTKELESDIILAKKDTETARLETEKVKLEIENAKKEASPA